jgi:hypothetical protein
LDRGGGGRGGARPICLETTQDCPQYTQHTLQQASAEKVTAGSMRKYVERYMYIFNAALGCAMRRFVQKFRDIHLYI